MSGEGEGGTQGYSYIEFGQRWFVFQSASEQSWLLLRFFDLHNFEKSYDFVITRGKVFCQWEASVTINLGNAKRTVLVLY